MEHAGLVRLPFQEYPEVNQNWILQIQDCLSTYPNHNTVLQ